MKLTLLLLAFAGIGTAQTSLAALDHGAVYEMSWLSDHWACRIYVTPGNAASPLTATIREVTMGTRSSTAFLDSFNAPQAFPQDGPLRAFDIATGPNAKLSKGTYDVGLELHAGKISEVKAIQLTIPAAAIAAQPLVVSRSTGWLLFPADKDSLPPLSVRETANKSFARLSVQQTDQATDSDGTHSGRLVFDPPAKTFLVEPNLPASLPYQVQGEFPVGTAKVNLGIYSDQVDSTVIVPVEVRTHVTRLALLAVLLIGLALGFLTRGLLKQRVELGQARRQALDEAAKLKSARDVVPDKIFRAQVDRAERTLLQAIENAHGGPQDGLKDAVAAAEKALTEATGKLNERVTGEEAVLKSFREFLQTTWIVPAEFMAALDSMRTDTQRAGELLEARNVAASETLTVETRNALRAFLMEAVGRWQTIFGDMGTAFETIGKLVEAGGPFPDELKKFRDAAGSVSPPAASAPLPDLGKTLDGLHMVFQQAVAISLNLSTAILSTFDRMSAEFHDPLLTRPLWATARAHTQQFCGRLPRSVADLDSLDGETATAAEVLRAEWRRALAAEHASKNALALFDKGQYVEAAKDVAQPRKKAARQDPPGGTGRGGRHGAGGFRR